MSEEIARGQIEQVIENRYRARLRAGEPERPPEDAYAQTGRELAEDLQAQHRAAWAMYHRRMASLHEGLAEEHRRKAGVLGSRGEGVVLDG